MPDVQEKIVTALKLRFPEPWFCDWRIEYAYFNIIGRRAERTITAHVRSSVMANGCGTGDIKTAWATYNDLDALLAAVESLPLPAAKAPGEDMPAEDYHKLVAWMLDPLRQEPALAFTAGPARAAASAFVEYLSVTPAASPASDE